ncbi:MAG: DUF192 domain-containing protein [Bacillota bacterium]
MKVYNATKKQCLADTAIMADTFIKRLKGLLGQPGLPAGWCMVLKPCSSIHTMFMRFSLDVLFVDRHSRVSAVVRDMPPYSFSGVVKDSRLVIEFPAGTLASTGTAPGDIIEIG